MYFNKTLTFEQKKDYQLRQSLLKQTNNKLYRLY